MYRLKILAIPVCFAFLVTACDKLFPAKDNGGSAAVSLPARGTVLTVTDPDYFNDVVFYSTNPVLVLFYTEESVPSVSFRKTFQELIPRYTENVVFAEVNLSDNAVASLEQQYTVPAVPSLLLLDQSLEHVRITGNVTSESITPILDKVLQ
jgi:thioredoxin-like negative regulator of GroEL